MAEPNAISGNIRPPNLILHVHLLWEPWRSEAAAIDQMAEEIREMGFNGLNIEAKPWEEFFQYDQDRESCFYLDAVLRTLDACRREGLQHSWMGFWAYGENLDLLGISPLHIRMGETCTIPEHLRPGDILAERYYKAWSAKMVNTLAEHHAGLAANFPGKAAQLVPDMPSTLVTGCELSIRPSFDEEGMARYRTWLAKHYEHDIEAFNEAYEVSFSSFDEINPEVYWSNYAGEKRPHVPWRHWHPDATEFLAGGPVLQRWVDNQQWRADESEAFAQSLSQAYRQQASDVGFWLWCNQWKQFFQDKDAAYWWHCDKGTDPWRMRQHLPEVGFITSPSDCYHRSSASALSAELAIARSVNRFEPFHAGLYLGRHILGDVYTQVTPAEAIATCLASGATRGLLAYGYNGLDDGGCLAQMPWAFRRSVRSGLDWFAHLQPHLKGELERQVAIVFPLATMLLEPVDSLEAERQLSPAESHKLTRRRPVEPVADFLGHRQDVLGWYRALKDAQYAVDFLHPNQIADGELSRYKAVILPWCPAYQWMRHPTMEAALNRWVEEGGLLICGPDESMLPLALRTEQAIEESDLIEFEGEWLMADGSQVASFPQLDPWATYRSGRVAIGSQAVGAGQVVRCGFHLGDAYEEPWLEQVAVGGHDSFFPVHLLRHSILGRLLIDFQVAPLWQGGGQDAWRDIELFRWSEGWIAINHSNHPWPLPPGWKPTTTLLDANASSDLLLPHDAAWIPDAS